MAEVLIEGHQRSLSKSLSRAGRLRRFSRPLFLILILLIAALFRFSNLDWDQNRHLHPDERYITVLASLLKSPGSLREYFNSGTSTLNPFNTEWGRSYVYGTLPLFAGRYIAEFMDGGCGPTAKPIPQAIGQVLFGADAVECDAGTFTGYDYMALIGRLWSGMADLMAVFVLFLIGRRLFGWRIGLLAAAFSAAAVLQIQQGHYFTVDSTANLFVVLTIYFCIQMVMNGSCYTQTSTWRPGAHDLRLALYALLAGFCTGCAIASKISVWPLVPLITLSLLIALARDPRKGFAPLVYAGLALGIAGITTFASFRVTQPYAFVGNSAQEFTLTLERCNSVDAQDTLVRVCALGAKLPTLVREIVAPSARWIEQLNLAQGYVNGTIDAPFGHQWANRTPIVFPLINLVFWGVGLPLGIAACIGFLYALRQLLRGRRWWAYLIPVLWAGLYFLYQGTQWTKSMRYLLPVYPALCLCAAVGLVALWRSAKSARLELRKQTGALWRRSGFWALSAVVLTAFVLAGNLVWALAFMQIYSGPITRVTASRWAYENIPTAVTARWNSAQSPDDIHQLQLPVKQLELSPGAVQRIQMQLDDRVSAGTINLQIILNNMLGGGQMRARLLADDGATELTSIGLEISPDSTTIPFRNLSLQPNTTYFIELTLLDGATLTARTSTVANEHWDDAVPQPVDGKDAYGSYYNGLKSSEDGQIQNYAEDTPDKLPRVLNWLDEADYLVMSSNRLYGSIPRLPWRFPMTTEYYRAMFNGELGFELVADFSAFPRIGPFVFNDQEMPQPLRRGQNTQGTSPGIEVPYPTAEEAFSVYDHPRVLIFKKTPAYSRALAEQVLGKYDLTRTIQQTPLKAVNTPGGMLFDDKTRQAQQEGGTWSELFPREFLLNQSQPVAVLAWLLLIEVLGLAAFPVIALATNGECSKTSIRGDAAFAGRHRTIAQPTKPTLADGGYSFAKVLALLLVALVTWWLASTKVAMFTALQIWGVILLLALISVVLWVRKWNVLIHLIRTRAPLLIASELVFLVAFAAFLLVRIGNPDLWHPYMGGEKPMDFAYLNGVLKSSYFPPIDPWFAGGYINYYYFGFVIIGAPIKALGIDPSVAYNIAIPTLYALTACGAFGIGATLYASVVAFARKHTRGEQQDRPIDPEEPGKGDADLPAVFPGIPAPMPPSALTLRLFSSSPPPSRTEVSAKQPGLPLLQMAAAGLLAAVFVVGLGNLRELDVIMPAWQKLGGIDTGVPTLVASIDGFTKWIGGAELPIYPNWPYWNPTRPTASLPVDAVQIAEFPLFTFLYADLHAHMMAMPIAYLALAFALAFAAGARRWPAIALGAAVVGSLWPTNSWDYPVYLLVCLAALVIDALHAPDQRATVSDVILRLLRVLPVLAVFAILTRAFFIPYLENYGAAYNSIEPWTNERTPLGIYLTIYGLFLVPLVIYLLWGIIRNYRFSQARFMAGLVFGLIALLAAAVLATLGAPIIIVALPLTALAFLAALMPGTTSQARLLWLLTAGAFALTIFVELFTLRGDIGRMNTLFKFYIQAWLILGVTSAVLVIWLFDRFAETRRQQTPAAQWVRVGLQPLFSAALVFFVLLAAAYPLFAIPAKIRDRYVTDAPKGLDGMAYMTRTVRTEDNNGKSLNFPLMDDYLAIKWMQDNVKGSPVIIEGTTGPNMYRWGDRFSIYTGLPSVVGWQWHQRQQRAALDDRIVYDRDTDLVTFYATTDISEALTIIRRYKARYVIVGALERTYYDEAGIPKFDALAKNGFLRVAYQNAGTTVYEINTDVVFAHTALMDAPTSADAAP
ncbi:MAG: DUF2298 domain-containing protein [Chloroflexi bacterium]|nr:DUF2298 domain-containing protein [Chloroflexota bacterium]